MALRHVAAKKTEDGDEGIGLMRLFECLNLVTVRE